MTNEKQKEMIKKILETTIDDTPSKSLDGYLEVAVEYLNMINKVITPMNPFTAPIAAAALGVMKEIVMKELNSEAKSAVKSIEILLKVSTRSEKYLITNKKRHSDEHPSCEDPQNIFFKQINYTIICGFFQGNSL